MAGWLRLGRGGVVVVRNWWRGGDRRRVVRVRKVLGREGGGEVKKHLSILC